ncbi:hypothetical protein VNO77_25134 [Canavalia gladiata]|uniref:Uncharacterized protein n=1 Tax=Canavalia gladiata TaxID=3824 RepID=A0AAN9LB01_CANGL
MDTWLRPHDDAMEAGLGLMGTQIQELLKEFGTFQGGATSIRQNRSLRMAYEGRDVFCINQSYVGKRNFDGIGVLRG